MNIKLARIRQIIGSLCVSAGVLAIANVETVWQEYHQVKLQESHDFLTPPRKAASAAHANSHAYKPLQLVLGTSLEQDELKDGNPFAHLSTLEPLQAIMQKGVAHFQRETYRSPDYHEESGYDLVAYQVEHTDGSKSAILAYLEKPEGSAGHAVGTPDNRVAFVIFMVANGAGEQSYFFFRDTALLQQSQLTTTEAQSLVSQRLSQGIPFLSVSR